MSRASYKKVQVNGVGRLEHLLIAEKALGKPLPKGVHVHHVNYDGRDNRNQNLVICENASYHKLLHFRQRILEAGGDPETQRICATCKTIKAIDDFPWVGLRPAVRGCYCRTCHKEYFDKHRKSKIVATAKLCAKHPDTLQVAGKRRRCIACLREFAANARAVRVATARTQTHCKIGHELTLENLYFNKGRRVCKACHKAYQLKRKTMRGQQ